MFRHVDLCSGIGGFALGFEWAGLSQPVLFCDIEEWPRKILAKHWPDVPIAEDVKELANDPDRNVPDCDIITAGYPCQPFSLAGERRGAEDDRHIWPDIFSIVQRKRPAWCVFENVYGHISMGLDEVLSDLERESYSVRPFIVPACATDAPHRRDRVWIIARNVGDTNSRASKRINSGKSKPTESGSGFESGCADVADTSGSGIEARERDRLGDGDRSRGNKGKSKSGSGKVNVADSNSAGLQGRQNPRDTNQSREKPDEQPSRRGERPNGQNWPPEPAVGRVANGISRRVDRLKGLGNAIVPQVAQRIGETIKQIEAKGG